MRRGVKERCSGCLENDSMVFWMSLPGPTCEESTQIVQLVEKYHPPPTFECVGWIFSARVAAGNYVVHDNAPVAIKPDCQLVELRGATPWTRGWSRFLHSGFFHRSGLDELAVCPY